MALPRVSVLLTCYNHLPFLREAWESVWCQTFRDFELIALDDCSSDGTREWLSERKENFELILNEQNLGTYGSLNRGLKLAKGEYVAVFNDDDRWAPQKLERQVALLDGDDEMGLAHTDGEFIDGSGALLEGAPLGFEFPRIESGYILPDFFYQNKVIASAALFRKSCVREIGPFDESYFGSGDWHMWARIAKKYKVGFVNEKLTSYRVHGANASHQLEKIWKDDVRLRTWLVHVGTKLLDPSDQDIAGSESYTESRIRDAVAHNWACLGTVKKLNGMPAEARQAYGMSLQYRPWRVKSMLRWVATFLPQPAFRRTL